jgi:hypothetical protein
MARQTNAERADMGSLKILAQGSELGRRARESMNQETADAT